MIADDTPAFQNITTGSFVQNAYLVWDPATREAVLVDPGEGSNAMLAALELHDVRLTGIWLTHAHIDHILGVEAVRAATGAPVWLHPADRRWYDALPEQGRMFGREGLRRPAPPEHELAAGDTLRVGRFAFEVRHVPGHSEGHVAFIGHGLCLSGDVLFQDSIGRTDLAGGDSQTLLDSIRRELWPLDDATKVLPGHGPQTTIGRERRNNPFLRG